MSAVGGSATGPGAALSAAIVVVDRGVDVVIDAAPGETVAIVGANGAGKTTVAEAIAGLVVPDAGVVRLGARVLHDLTSPARTWTPVHRRRVGLLDQRPILFGGRTVLDAVAFPVRAAGRSRAASLAAARGRLDEVGLAGIAGDRHDRISGGQAQRVAFARVLAADPELLVLDEPFAALDAASAESVRDLVRAERGRRTTLLITHDPLDVIRLADRVVVLDGGLVVEHGEVASVLGSPTTEAGRAFTHSRVVSGTVRGRMLEVADGPLAGARIPVDAAIADGRRLVAGIGPDGLVLPGR